MNIEGVGRRYTQMDADQNKKIKSVLICVPFLSVPCLTARPNTERPVTITRGTNQLVASSRTAIVQAARNVLNHQPEHSNLDRPDLWDGRAAERIIEVLRSWEGAR